MAARRKANILGSRSLNGSSKPLPTILNRKRKRTEHEEEEEVSWWWCCRLVCVVWEEEYGCVLVVGKNLWSQESLKLIKEDPGEFAEDKTKWTKNLEDRRNLLNIEASLALSFMTGLVKGSAKYLDDRATKKNSVTVSSVYYATNTKESVTQDMRENLDYPQNICSKVGKKNNF